MPPPRGRPILSRTSEFFFRAGIIFQADCLAPLEIFERNPGLAKDKIFLALLDQARALG